MQKEIQQEIFVTGRIRIWVHTAIAIATVVGLLHGLGTFYSSRISWKKGIDYANERQWDKAIQEYTIASKLAGPVGELEFNFGSAQLFAGQITRSIVNLEAALTSYNDRNLHLSLAIAEMRQGNYAKARSHASMGLAMFPDHLAPHLILGEIYYYEGDTERSKKELLICINLETQIFSNDTFLIQRNAEQLWEEFYGSADR